MHFLERESNALKFYLERELSPICDADPKVLADYILALLKHDYPIETLRANIKSDLADFMATKGFEKVIVEQEPFLENLFQSLNDQSYLDVQTDDDIEIEYLVEDPTLLDTKDFNNNYVNSRDQNREFNGRESRRDDYRDRDHDRDRDRDLRTRDLRDRNRDNSRDDYEIRGRDRGRDRKKRPCFAFQSKHFLMKRGNAIAEKNVDIPMRILIRPSHDPGADRLVVEEENQGSKET